VLSAISAFAPRHIQDQTLPLLFSSLPDRVPSSETADDRARRWHVLSALSKLCVHQELFEVLVIRLTTKLDLTCVPTTRHTTEDEESNAAYAHSLLKTIAKTLSTKVDKGHLDVAKYIDRLVPRLYNLFIYSALLNEAPGLAAIDPRIISIAGEIVTLVVQCVPLSLVCCVYLIIL
jgi:DNA repair/transcription protein MET18/MMS19